MYSCDFECTTGVTSDIETRVWAWGVMEIDGKFDSYTLGNDIDSFMHWVEKERPTGYIHNIRYDATFIISWLETNDFRFSKEEEDNTYNAFINGSGVMYSLNITYKSRGKKTRKTARFKGSEKKLPMSVREIAKSFGLGYGKGEIDYHKDRPIGYEMDEHEKDYLIRDIKIVAEAIYQQVTVNGLDKLTVSSDAMTGFKESLLDREDCKIIKARNTGKNGKVKSGAKEEAFRKFFPLLDVEKVDKRIRKAYRGGYTYVNRKYEGEVLPTGRIYDVNSLYSYVMRERMLPWGVPVEFEGEYINDEKYPLWVGMVSFAFALNEGYLPIIQVKGKNRWADNLYLDSSDDEVIPMTVTSVDWALYNEHYHIYDVEFHGGFKFKQRNDMFTTYVDFWKDQKDKAKDDGNLGLYTIAKTMLNALYGKFSANPEHKNKIPYVIDRTVYYKDDDPDVGKPEYTAVGVFITAYARQLTINACQSSGDHFIYADTDSLHVLGNEVPESLKDVVHKDKIGYWDHEATFVRAKYLRQKTYVYDVPAKWVECYENGNLFSKLVKCPIEEHTHTITVIKCAGMPAEIHKRLTFDTFSYGFAFKGDAGKGIAGKVEPVNIKGGQILVDVTYRIQKPVYLSKTSLMIDWSKIG